MIKIPKEGNIVVKFGATWCGPCKQIKPIIEELAKENVNIEFIDVDIDKDLELARKYAIKSIPAVLFIQDGEIKSNFVGFKTKKEIQENINLLVE